MEYLLTPPVIVVGIGGYLGAIFGTPEAVEPLWWLAVYGGFVGLNVLGVEASFRFTVFITVFSLLILAVFYVAAIGHVDLERYAFDVAPRAGETAFLPHGWLGVLAALPFAMWFYLAIEQLPLAAEGVSRSGQGPSAWPALGFCHPRGLCILHPDPVGGNAPGAAHLGTSDEPLFWGFRALFGSGAGSVLLPLLAVSGLWPASTASSSPTVVRCTPLASGLLPTLPLAHSSNQEDTSTSRSSPCAALGYPVALAIHLAGSDHPVGANAPEHGGLRSRGQLRAANAQFHRPAHPQARSPPALTAARSAFRAPWSHLDCPRYAGEPVRRRSDLQPSRAGRRRVVRRWIAHFG